MAIKSWASDKTQKLFEREQNMIVPPHVSSRARRKLLMLHAAAEIEFLKAPPGNRLEKLKGDRTGQWSLRINDRFRLCFVFRAGNAYQVRIVDYH